MIMIGFVIGIVFMVYVMTMQQSKECKERFDRGYELLSKQKEFLTSTDIEFLEQVSGHIYNEEI